MSDKLLTYLDIPSTGVVPSARTGFVRIYSRNNLVYQKDENNEEKLLTNVSVPPSSGGGVTSERLSYDHYAISKKSTESMVNIQVVLSETNKDSVEFVTAAVLGQATESGKRAVEDISNTVTAIANEVAKRSSETMAADISTTEINRKSADTAVATIIPTSDVAKRAVETSISIVNANLSETAKRATETISGVIVPLKDSNRRSTDVEQVSINYTGYANATVSNTNFTTPENALGNNTNTAAELRATSSGLTGATSNTVTGTLVIGFANPQTRDVPVGSLVTINIERDVVTGGTLPVGQSHTVVYQYTLDGTNYTTVSAPGTTIAKSTVTTDITSLVAGDYTKLDNLQVRVTGSVTSGTGLNATLAARIMRAWVSFTADKTY